MAILTGFGTKGGTLRATTTHGYRITFPSKGFVSALSKTGTFWVKPLAPTDAVPGADPTVAAIPGTDATSDFIEMKDGDTWTAGVSAAEGVRQVGGAAGTVAALLIWCELAGDLIVVLQ